MQCEDIYEPADVWAGLSDNDSLSYRNKNNMLTEASLSKRMLSEVAPVTSKPKKKFPRKYGGSHDPLVAFHNQSHTARNRYHTLDIMCLPILILMQRRILLARISNHS